jgi:hypothetical protein
VFSSTGIDGQFFPISEPKGNIEVDLGGLTRFLRFVHPEKTASNVAADTGLPYESVKKWLVGAAAPGFRATMVLIAVYGPDLIASAFRSMPAWLSSEEREERLARIEAEIRFFEAE